MDIQHGSKGRQTPIFAAVRGIYDELRLELTDDAAARMRAYLDAKPKGKHGRFEYERLDSKAIAAEREQFRAYQEFFGVPNEI